ncbi:MAG: PEP-CTERM sorting domain-containing protein [Sulfitobacter sp.]|nr:PEP-CTERM sorting domain-containing protein [Sulfitobacter sp.]
MKPGNDLKARLEHYASTASGETSGGRCAADIAGGAQLTSNTAGNFFLDVTGFVGIRLASDNYGWIRLQQVEDLGVNQPYTTILSQFNPPRQPFGTGTNFADRLTVIDWAYETSGGAIHVGDTGSVSVPEPSPLALLAAGALGIGAFRRRQAQRAEAR